MPLGLKRVELLTPSLSEKCSNRLSYSPSVNTHKKRKRKSKYFSLIVCAVHRRLIPFSQKGGDPAAPSGTATLLRLHPPYQSYLRQRTPHGYAIGFGYHQLGWCDGRCVQGPGTYSPRRADARLLAIPTSWSRVSDSNPNYGCLSAFCSSSCFRFSLSQPL